MKLTQHLCKQHIKWYFKKFWISQGARKVIDTNLEKILAEKSIPVFQPEDILNEKRERIDIEVIGCKPKPVKLDQTHPNWHDRPLLTYKDSNVLVEGLQQAKILTNTVEIKDGLPESIVSRSCKDINKTVEDIILRSHLFDAEQQKLPKIKDPLRPAWNFPRVYGITQQRIIKLLTTNLLHLIETRSVDLAKDRYLFDDLLFSYAFERNNDLIQFELRGDTLLTSAKPLGKITENTSGNAVGLPDLAPISPTITLNPVNVYEISNIYPINLKLKKSHPHTLIFNHLATEVKNLYEEEVTEQQIYGRSLLKTFTTAAAYAKHKFGDVKQLPEPVTVQCVQTDGRRFHFGVLQLNTLDLQTNDVRNIWYQTDNIPLFDCCEYRRGRPVLQGYNSQVVQYLEAFYNRV